MRYLFKKYKDIDINVCNDTCFRKACSNGHIGAVRYLLKISDNIDINAVNNDAFISACLNGKYWVVRYLFSLQDHNINNDVIFCAFYTCCYTNNLNMVKYFLETPQYNINIRFNYDKCFIMACKSNFVDLAFYLSTYCDDYSVCKKHNTLCWEIKQPIVFKNENLKKEIMEECPVCFENTCDIITDCDHQICLSCFKKMNNKCHICRNLIKTVYKV